MEYNTKLKKHHHQKYLNPFFQVTGSPMGLSEVFQIACCFEPLPLTLTKSSFFKFLDVDP